MTGQEEALIIHFTFYFNVKINGLSPSWAFLVNV